MSGKRSYRRKAKKPRYNSIKKMISTAIRKTSETKVYTHNYDAESVSTTSTDADLYGSIVQGDGSNERIGDVIYATGIYGKFFFTTADATNLLRAVIYIPRRADTTLSMQSQDGVASRIDPVNFRVLSDKTYMVHTYKPQAIGVIRYKFNGKGMKMTFDPDTGSIQSPRVRVCLVSDSGAVTHPTITMNLACYYKDY